MAIPTSLHYESLDVGQATISLRNDINKSSNSLLQYFTRQTNMCSRLPVRCAVEYVSSLPENLERFNRTYRAERHTQLSFYAGSILALRTVLLSPAALIALRAGWRDVVPPVEGEFIRRTDEIEAQAVVIAERADAGLEQAAAIRYELADWSYDLTGNTESAHHLRQGFGYTLRSLELATSARVEADINQLLSHNFATPNGEQV